MKRSEIPIYHAAEITYRGQNSSYNSAVHTGGNTLEETRHRLNFHLLHLEHIGAMILSFEIASYCLKCAGSGTVATGKRTRPHKTCPNCKGQPKIDVIDYWEHWRVTQNLVDVCTHPHLDIDFYCPSCSFHYLDPRTSLDEAMVKDWSEKTGGRVK